jgi:hypothetical protein
MNLLKEWHYLCCKDVKRELTYYVGPGRIVLGSHQAHERRNHPRFKVDLPLEYRVLDAPQTHGGLVINASESGLLVHSTKDIPVGTKLNIVVLFPKGFELADCKIVAEIVWKNTIWGENHAGYRLGLRFIRILDEELHKLKQLLAENSDTEI